MKGVKTGGRVAGTPNKANQDIKALIDSEIDFALVLKKLYELVKGVEMVDGESNIYSKPPDAGAAKLLLEYRFGKPTQSIEVSTPKGIQITRTIIDRANKS